MKKFTKANSTIAYKKLAVFGGAGAGKTIIALSAPGKKYVIDTEGGSLPYASLTDFEVLPTQSFGEIKEVIDGLYDNPPSEETSLIIDSGSIIWAGLQQAMLEKKLEKEGMQAKYGTERVQFSMADWGILKKWNKDIFNTLMALKCHVVCTFRESEQRDETTFKGTGVFNPEWEKNSPYTFSFVGRVHDRSLTFTKGRLAKDGQLIDIRGKNIPIPIVQNGQDLSKIWESLFGNEGPAQAAPTSLPSTESKDVGLIDKDPASLNLSRKIRSELAPKAGVSAKDLDLYCANKKMKDGSPFCVVGEDGKVHLSEIPADRLQWLADVLNSEKSREMLITRVNELKGAAV